MSEDPIQQACSAQWQAESGGKNQYDAMLAAIRAYLLAEERDTTPNGYSWGDDERSFLKHLAEWKLGVYEADLG